MGETGGLIRHLDPEEIKDLDGLASSDYSLMRQLLSVFDTLDPTGVSHAAPDALLESYKVKTAASPKVAPTKRSRAARS